jgi:hypothetical protein
VINVVVVVVVYTEVVVLDAGLDGDGTDDWRRADEEKDETQVLPTDAWEKPCAPIECKVSHISKTSLVTISL